MCSDAVDETEEKIISIFKSLGEGCRTFFWFGLVLKKIFKKFFVFAITDGMKIYNRRKDKLQSDFKIDS